MRRDLIAPILVVMVAILGAAFLLVPGLLHGFDTTMHLFRVEELDHQIQNGVLYPRWFDGLVFDYGYPVFQFYAPLVYYLGEGFYLLGLSFGDSLKAIGFLARVIGGLGAYYFARETLRSRLAATTAAVAFLLASYQYTDLVERAAFPELVEMNIFPWALWAINRVIDRRAARDVAIGAGLVAALVLVHQSTALVSGVGIGAYAGFELARTWLAGRNIREVWSIALLLAVVAGLGLLVSSFYWLPAFIERSDVPLESLIPGQPSFVDQLLNVSDVIQPGFFYVYPFPAFIRLNFVEVGLASISLVVGLIVRPTARPILAFFALLGLAYTLGMTTLSRPFWDQLPFVTLMQFPYRLEMYTSLAFALLAGAIAFVPRREIGLLGSCTIVAVLAASTVGHLDPWQRSVNPASISAATFARLETAGKWAPIGTTVPTQFLPRWVKVLPESLPISRASADRPIETASLHATAQVLNRNDQQLKLAVSTDQPLTFRFHGFYFPDWGAAVDGRSVTVQPLGPEALLSFTVPSGEHQVGLDFGSGGVTRWAEVISVIAAGIIVFLCFAKGKRWRGRRLAVIGIVAVVASLLPLAARSVVADHGPRVHPAVNQFPGCLQLAGWESRVDARSDSGVLALTLYWFTRCDPVSDQEVIVELRNQSGQLFARSHRQPHWGTAPTSTWYAGELVRDEQVVALPVNPGGGTYSLGLGVASPGGGSVAVQSIGSVELPGVKPRLPQVHPIALRSEPIEFNAGLSMVGWDVERATTAPPGRLRPGESLKVRLLLKARDDVPLDAVVSVFLLDNQQRKYSPRDSYPPSDFSYSATWLPGEINPLDITVPVPADLAPGQYTLAFELYDFRNGERLKMIGDRARGPGNSAILQQFKVPLSLESPPSNPVAASFAGVVALDGYDAAVETGKDGRDDQVTLHLRWRALRTPLQDYHSFTHVYDRAGKLVTQHDGPLGGMAYPSSIWDAGESVVDRHTIGLVPEMTPGIYSLRAGLYLPSTGQRLSVDGGGDTVELGKIEVDNGSAGLTLRIVPSNRPS